MKALSASRAVDWILSKFSLENLKIEITLSNTTKIKSAFCGKVVKGGGVVNKCKKLYKKLDMYNLPWISEKNI